MGGIVLHTLNGAGRLQSLLPAIRSSFDDWTSLVSERLEIEAVDVVVCADPAAVIPEVGLGGYTPAADRVFLAVDDLRRWESPAFTRSFGLFLAHELHHAARWRTVGYGTTLREALVTEGLACMFESELAGGEVPFYARALGPAELAGARALANAELDSPTYDHAAWFYGTANVPRHAGYALGFEVVRSFCAARASSASQLVGASAQQIYAET